jgi:hypothetical protein
MPRSGRELEGAPPTDDRGFDRPRAHAAGWAAVVLPLAGLVMVWGLAIAWWPTLPARIPLHFDASGRPDRWGSSSQWFLLPMIATLVIGLVGGIGAALPAVVRSHPGLVNTPRKKQWLALDAEARLRALLPMRWLLAWVGVFASGLFVWTLAGTRWVAMDPDPANPTRTIGGAWIVLAFVGVILVGVLLASVAVFRRIGEETRRAEEANAAAAG